jgi:rhodanese-related sulfurtransferase
MTRWRIMTTRTDQPRPRRAPAGRGHQTMTVDDLLAEARSVLPHRLGPAEALAAHARGALLIDIRGDDQRRADGLIPGALVLPRNSLEWRCDPTSRWRHPIMTDWSRPMILICNEGCQSSLAAATLHRLGLVNATDLAGGFGAWAAAGLAVASTEQPTRRPWRLDR